jgi:Ctr copper transporter family
VAVMLGAGAEHWLRRIQTGPLEESHSPIVVNLRATRHAVTMPAGQSRAWYGMSTLHNLEYRVREYLFSFVLYSPLSLLVSTIVCAALATVHTVPADAIIQDFPKRTFSEMRQAMVLAGKTPRTYGAGQSHSGNDGQAGDVMAIGCGAASASELTLNGATRINRRRIQMVSDASVCNNVTNFFCWMSCLEIPEANSAAGFLTEGYSLYCLDPGTLAKTGNKVSAAQEVCNLNGVIGGAHQDSCLGSWQKTAPGVAYQEVSLTDPSLLAPQTEFCYGGTSMYMDGFHWTDPTCVIYLFPSWVLNSVGLLTGASIGTIIFAIALEAVIWQRRSIVPSCPEGFMRLGASTLFYGVQLTMGYLLMLVVMIYSGPLFFSVIMGLMIGHALFNGGGFRKPKRKSSDDYVDGTHENSSDGLERAGKTGPSCCADGVKATEGLTPCCQNTL